MKKRFTWAFSVSAAALGLATVLLWDHQDSDSGKDPNSPPPRTLSTSNTSSALDAIRGVDVPIARPPRLGIIEPPVGDFAPPGYAERRVPSPTDLEHIQNLRSESVALAESLRSAGMSEDEISAMQQAAKDHINQLLQPEVPSGPALALDTGMLRSNLSESLKGAGYSQEAIEGMTAAMIPVDQALPPPPEAEMR